MQNPTPREHFGLALATFTANIAVENSCEKQQIAAKRGDLLDSPAMRSELQAMAGKDRLKALQNPLTHGFVVDNKVRSAAFEENLHSVISDLEYLQNGLAYVATRLFNSGLSIEISPLCNAVTVTGAYKYALQNLVPPAARKQAAM